MENFSELINLPPPSQPCPAVSVVIPMFNAEKYLADALDSVLAQTFQNFEVIVVDDCSTDSSCDIVKSYAEKFGGRLKLTHMEYNTGSGALPRNKGLAFSRGEYIFFMDADDLITKTALEELYTLAKNYDADVVYCDDNYRMNSDGSNVHRENADKQDLVDKPTFEPSNMAERVQKILRGNYLVPPWKKFVRRSLMIEHEIKFPWCKISEDDIWTYGLVFHAKKFLRVPNKIYFRRLSEDSIMRTKRTPQQTINFWMNPLLLGLKALDKFMSRHEFFQQNPQYRYAVLEKFINDKSNAILKDSFQLSTFAVYDTIKREFGDKLDGQEVLICALCTALNTQQKNFVMAQQQFQRFAAQAQEQVNQFVAQVREQEKFFKQFAAAAQARIAELETELKKRQS